MALNDLECPIQLKVRMSHGLSADNVDTSLASLLCSCTTDVVFSEVHNQWASRERCVQLTRCFSAVAELIVSKSKKHDVLLSFELLHTFSRTLISGELRNRNFINRMLFKYCYWLCRIFSLPLRVLS